MRFFGYFRSSAAYRCRIAFNLKGIDYDFAPVHLRKDGGQQKSGQYLALNPQGLVPTIEDSGHSLTQSLAIIEWLEETHPQPALLPNDTHERAAVRAFALSIACEIHPLQNLRVLDYLRNEFGLSQDGLDRWCRRWIGEGLSACEVILARRPKSAFCFGETPTLADICLIPQVLSAERFGVNLAPLPRIRAAAESCGRLREFAEAHPSRQPDAE